MASLSSVPSQLSPMKPLGQVQVYPSTASTQVAVLRHGELSHSSMSEIVHVYQNTEQDTMLMTTTAVHKFVCGSYIYIYIYIYMHTTHSGTHYMCILRTTYL